MEAKTAQAVVSLMRKIRDARETLEKIQRIKGDRLKIRTDDCSYEIPVPKELQETVYMLIRTAYENELNELVNQLEEL